jgi:guanine nucleotide-binding protein subunit gamma
MEASWGWELFTHLFRSSLIEYCNSTKDPLVPSIWGPVSKDEDPFAPAAGGSNSESGCCIVM